MKLLRIDRVLFEELRTFCRLLLEHLHALELLWLIDVLYAVDQS